MGPLSTTIMITGVCICGIGHRNNPVRYHIDHYCDVIMGAVAFQINSFAIVYSTVYSDADQRKHQSSASLAFVRGIHRGPVNSPHKWPVTRKMFPFDDVIMILQPEHNGRHLAADILKSISRQEMNTFYSNLIEICSNRVQLQIR